MNPQVKNSTITGCVLIAVGAWVGLAPFLAGGWEWEWHFGRFLLAVLPGTAAVLGGLVMLGGRRLAVNFGGMLALAGGLWFVVGPPMYALFVGPELGTLSSGLSVRMVQWVGFFFVAGAFISLLSSYALGFLAPLKFPDRMWAEPATTTRARVPLPPERSRRQRGVREPVPQPAGHARAKESAQRDSRR
jgi:hypothetical protein